VKAFAEGDTIVMTESCSGSSKGEVIVLKRDSDGELHAGKCSCTGKWKLYVPPEVPKGGAKMMNSIKDYMKKHQDVIFTLVIIILVDHFVFNGALKNKIKETLEGILDTTKKVA
jgi:hypothetical protein